MTPDEFWARVDRSGGPEACWPWTGYTDANGYGCLRRNGRGHERAHVVALELDGRPVGPGQVGRHLCVGSKRCCNPKHLAPGSRWDDAQDRVRAGTKPNKPLSAEREAALADLYLRGLATSPELARLFGIASYQVRRIGRRALLADRRRAGQPGLL